MHDDRAQLYLHSSPLALLRGRASLSVRFNRAASAAEHTANVMQLDLQFAASPADESRAEDPDVTE